MKILKTISALAVSALIAAASYGADYSFSGNLAGDNDVQLFNFTVGAASTVTLRTWSYAGGTNAAGNLIAEGGFDPILALFDSTGLLINQNDDGGSLVAADSVTGAHYDTYLSSVLSAGDYTVAVMQYANFALGPNLSSGFQGSGTTNFRDVTGDLRTSAWEFDILNVAQASTTGVPDGGDSLLLVSAGLGLILFTKRLSRMFC